MPSEHGKVEVPDPEAVDAVDRGDLFRVLYAGRRLDLREKRGAGVRGGELVENGAARVMVVRDAERHAALALRRVFHAVEDRARFLRVVHHRHHDAFGAHVHGAGDVVIFLRRHAHDGGQRRRFEIAKRRS